MSGADTIRLLICGSGNGAHAFAGIAASLEGTDVRVLSLFQDEAERWNAQMEKRDLEVTLLHKGKEPVIVSSKPSLITKNPEEALHDVDIVVFVLPAFAHQVFLNTMAPYIKPGTVLVGLPGSPGFEFEVRHLLGEKGKQCTIMNFDSLPWACRITEYGAKCEVLGTKDSLVGGFQVGNFFSLLISLKRTLYVRKRKG